MTPMSRFAEICTLCLWHCQNRVTVQDQPRAPRRTDDGQGSIPIVLGYMNDVNDIVHIEGAAFFMSHFKRLRLPLRAVLGQEKTRVVTHAGFAHTI